MVVMLLGIIALAGCSVSEGPKIYVIEGPIMGTQYHVKVVLDEDRQELLPELERGVVATLQEVDRLMSTYKPDSEVSRFNRLKADDWFPVSLPTWEVLARSQEISSLTGGAFDITVGPLVNLWGFGPGERTNAVPTETEVSRIRDEIGYQFLHLNGEARAIRKVNPDIEIDLSAIAKGYSVDQVAAYLLSHSVPDFLVEVGGEIRVGGSKPGNESWRLAIEKPQEDQRSVQQVLALSDIGMATSGDYRNYYEREGTRYSHTIDPRTGFPIRHTLASVSVLHDSCAIADALATAFMTMGTKQAMEYAVKHDIAAYFIDRSGEGFQVSHSPAFDKYLQR